MKLHPMSREYYRLQITTHPDVETGEWEASFDGGATWHDPTVIDTDAAWLVAGPDVEAGDAVVIETTTYPLIRLTDDPEVIVRQPPRIELVG